MVLTDEPKRKRRIIRRLRFRLVKRVRSPFLVAVINPASRATNLSSRPALSLSRELREMIDWPGLVREEGPRVWKVAYRLLGNHADAADCVQEAFTQALEISRREAVRSWSGLLRRLATVQSIQKLRCRYRETARSAALTEDYVLPSAEPGPVEHAEAAELAQALRHALTDLSPQEATVFCLRCLDDLSYREIADQMHLEVNTVGVILHRARGRLRDLLADFVRKSS
jgi:RNA polymerase sigma factor (sigma-70 family)